MLSPITSYQSPTQTFPTGSQDDPYLTFSDPFSAITTENNSTSPSPTLENSDDENAAERLFQLLKSGCMAFTRNEIMGILARVCCSTAYENAELALAEICLEVNMLSGVSGGIGKRITVWFDSYSQRLNLRTADGQTDCICLAGMLS